MKYFFSTISLFLAIALQVCLGSSDTNDPYVLSIDGKDGPGQGKLVVLVSGDEEYRTEESMPMLAKIFYLRSMVLIARFCFHGMTMVHTLIPITTKELEGGIISIMLI